MGVKCSHFCSYSPDQWWLRLTGIVVFKAISQTELLKNADEIMKTDGDNMHTMLNYQQDLCFCFEKKMIKRKLRNVQWAKILIQLLPLCNSVT